MLVGVMMDTLRLVERRATGRGGPPVRSAEDLDEDDAFGEVAPFMPEEAAPPAAAAADTAVDIMGER